MEEIKDKFTCVTHYEFLKQIKQFKTFVTGCITQGLTIINEKFKAECNGQNI